MPAADLRVYLCDDSAVARLSLGRLLRSAPGIELVGESGSGRGALREIPRLEPDLVLMDAVMPAPDGVEVTRRLLERGTYRILMISDLAGRDARLGFRALEAGALDLLPKPSREELTDERKAARWLRRLRRLADVPLVTRRRTVARRTASASPAPPNKAPGEGARRRIDRVALGISTGGPPALLRLLQELGPSPPWPLLVVQHITPGFAEGLSGWLADASGARVCMARAGDTPAAGTVYLAPDGHHLVWRPGPTPAGRLDLDSSEPRWGHRPSVDVLFESLADAPSAPSTCAVLMTGMGRDGALGLQTLRRQGAWTLAQDEASSTVWGMPKAALDLDPGHEVVSLDDLARRLVPALSSR